MAERPGEFRLVQGGSLQLWLRPEPWICRRTYTQLQRTYPATLRVLYQAMRRATVVVLHHGRQNVQQALAIVFILMEMMSGRFGGGGGTKEKLEK